MSGLGTYLARSTAMHTLLAEQTIRALLDARRREAAADNLAARMRAVRRWQRRKDRANRHLHQLELH